MSKPDLHDAAAGADAGKQGRASPRDARLDTALLRGGNAEARPVRVGMFGIRMPAVAALRNLYGRGWSDPHVH